MNAVGTEHFVIVMHDGGVIFECQGCDHALLTFHIGLGPEQSGLGVLP